MNHQDWAPLTLKSTNAAARPATMNRQTKSQPSVSSSVSEMRKIAESEGGKPKMLSPQSRTTLAQARTAKGWLQKDLDAKGSFPLNSCNAWEAGRLCPTSQQIQSLHHLLGIKLERQ